MAASTTTETDQAIKQLTDQIAKLSINLAQQQQPLQPQPANYAATLNTNRPPAKDSCRCHYCECTGYFIAKCRTR